MLELEEGVALSIARTISRAIQVSPFEAIECLPPTDVMRTMLMRDAGGGRWESWRRWEPKVDPPYEEDTLRCARPYFLRQIIG